MRWPLLCCLLVAAAAAAPFCCAALPSLRTFQAHACDGEELRLRCAPGTAISVQLAQYGRQGAGSLCGGRPATCSSDNALQVVAARCGGLRVCRNVASGDLFQGDPCPGHRKYAEVAYQCRPVEAALSTTPHDLIRSDATTNASATTDASAKPRPGPLVAFLSEWIAAHRHLAGHRDKLILLVAASTGGGLLAFLAALGLRRLRGRRPPPPHHPAPVRRGSDAPPRAPVGGDGAELHFG